MLRPLQKAMKKAAAIQRKSILRLSLLLSKSCSVKAVLNYMGFEAGPTRLPLVPAPEEDAKRIIKVVVDGDYPKQQAAVTGVLGQICKDNKIHDRMSSHGFYSFSKQNWLKSWVMSSSGAASPVISPKISQVRVKSTWK